jgi:hypothetical protein
LHKYSARDTGLEPKLEPRQGNNEVPQELVLNLLAQGYPLEELLEFFPMFTLDQLMLLLDDEIIQ